MRLHLATISDLGCKYLDEEYKTPTGTLYVGDLAEKKNHNIMMIDIASALSYAEFDEVKDCKTTFDMWNGLKDIYGGDENVRRANAESLIGQFDQMRMREDYNVAKYMERIKTSVSTIRASRGEIKEETIVSKILRTLLPIYAIRVSSIQEKRCDSNKKLGLDSLVRILIALELDNFDNYVPASKNIESTFEAKISLNEKGRENKRQSITK